MMQHTGRLAAAVVTLALALGSAAGWAQTANEDSALEQPQAEVTAEHQDWIVRCQPAPEEAFGAGDLCEMYQQVSEQNSQQTVLEVVIGYPQGAEQPIALFNLPLGMRLPPGVALSVDGNDPVNFPIQICLRSGCRTDIALNEELLSQMLAGTQAQLTIADPQNREIQLPLSLLGFSAALDDVQASTN